MLRLGFYILILCCVSFAHGQKESANWYFGSKAGVSFNGLNPIALTDGKLRTNEGCATISNNRGELLFYTDGITVWDRHHNIMPNGEGLLGHPSSTQSAIIVPKPLSHSVYYIFTVIDAGNIEGLRYSEVDMELNNGDGAVTSKKNILLATPCTEKITAVQHANGKDFWVIAHGWDSADFLSFKVTGNGIIDAPIISTVGAIHTGERNNSIGYMKASPNGKKIALARWNIDSLVEVFDFDSSTGILTNPITIDGFFGKEAKNGAYGLEFSPNSKLLYVSDLNLGTYSSKLFQFDLSSNNKNDIIDSHVILYNGTNLLSAIQLALDRKIYVSNSITSSLDIIENPNAIGLACNYVNKGLKLNGAYAVYGLPPFVQSFFVARVESSDVCFGDANHFNIETDEPIDSVEWDFGDGFYSNENSPDHHYSEAGVYAVKAEVKSGVNTYYLETRLEVYENPIIKMRTDWVVCDNQPITLYLDSVHDAYLWSTGETTANIMVDKKGTYAVTVYNKNSNGDLVCETSLEITVIKSGLPHSVDIETTDWTNETNSISIQAYGMGDYEYSLDNENYQDYNTFQNLDSGDYTVYIRDKNGCGFYERDVYLLNYPKYFTPNGDGFNDIWNIVGTGPDFKATINIYDRYGKLIKQIHPNYGGWDGTFKGEKMPSDDYWFKITFLDAKDGIMKEFNSHFTLKR